MAEGELRAEIVRVAQAMAASGLSPGKSGNVSARLTPGADDFLVTPTGLAYGELVPERIVALDGEGRGRPGELRPSSEWRMHLGIFRAKPEAQAIVHTHSEAATALACTRRPIPAFHYMVAAAGGKDIPCAPYATYGSEELAAHAVAALRDRKACLLANHGVLATGPSLDAALALAEEVEALAAQYVRALTIGDVVILDDAEMARVIDKFSTYGQQ